MNQDIKNKTTWIDQRFRQVWQRFNANLESLWIFSQEMIERADEWDKQLAEGLAIDIANLFGDDVDEVKQDVMAYIPALDTLEFEPSYIEDASVREIIESLDSGKFKRRVQKWLSEYPYKQHDFLDVLRRTFRQPPANGILLRRSAFIMLVSFFEILLTDLQVAIWLVDSDSTITVPENISIESDRDTWLREQISKKRMHITEMLENISVKADSLKETQLRKDIDVIRERRNLLVHKDGVIDENYLSRKLPGTEKAWMEPHLRQRWLVSSVYFQKSLEQIHLLGTMLIVGCWKHFTRRVSAQAARELVEASYLGLTGKRYNFVIELGRYAEKIKLPQKKQYRDTVRVNWAIALQRIQDDSGEINFVLNKLQQSRSPKILTAKYILMGQSEKALEKLRSIQRSGNLHEINFDWPLFEPFWGNLNFKNLFEVNMGKLDFKKR